MSLALVGFGLIGGSIARAIQHAGSEWSTTAWSPSGNGPRTAAADGTIAAAGTLEEVMDGADLVVLAAPPLACLELIDRLGGSLRGPLGPGSVVTHLARTKGVIV